MFAYLPFPLAFSIPYRKQPWVEIGRLSSRNKSLAVLLGVYALLQQRVLNHITIVKNEDLTTTALLTRGYQIISTIRISIPSPYKIVDFISRTDPFFSSWILIGGDVM
jgi:hypothetical protein